MLCRATALRPLAVFSGLRVTCARVWCSLSVSSRRRAAPQGRTYCSHSPGSLASSLQQMVAEWLTNLCNNLQAHKAGEDACVSPPVEPRPECRRLRGRWATWEARAPGPAGGELAS